MNSTPPREAWSRLAAAARRVRDERDTAAPFGFATRVAALAFADRRPASILDRFALRALGVACLLAIASIAVNYSAFTQTKHKAALPEDEVQFAPVEDPVAVLLDA